MDAKFRFEIKYILGLYNLLPPLAGHKFLIDFEPYLIL